MKLTKRAVAKVAKIPVNVLDDNIKNLTDGLGIELPKRRNLNDYRKNKTRV